MFNQTLYPFRSFFDDEWLEPRARVHSPPCEIQENKEGYLIAFDVPGIKKDDLKIQLKDNVLTLEGERHFEKNSTENQTQLSEKSYGRFQRSFTLPDSVITDKIEADHENGVLHVFIPKAKATQPKTISIESKGDSFLKKLFQTKSEENVA